MGAMAEFDLPMVLLPPLFERPRGFPKRVAWRVALAPSKTSPFVPVVMIPDPQVDCLRWIVVDSAAGVGVFSKYRSAGELMAWTCRNHPRRVQWHPEN